MIFKFLKTSNYVTEVRFIVDLSKVLNEVKIGIQYVETKVKSFDIYMLRKLSYICHGA